MASIGSPCPSSIIAPLGSRVSSFINALHSPVIAPAGARLRQIDVCGGIRVCSANEPTIGRSVLVDAAATVKSPLPAIPNAIPNASPSLTSNVLAAPVQAVLRLDLGSTAHIGFPDAFTATPWSPGRLLWFSRLGLTSRRGGRHSRRTDSECSDSDGDSGYGSHGSRAESDCGPPGVEHRPGSGCGGGVLGLCGLARARRGCKRARSSSSSGHWVVEALSADSAVSCSTAEEYGDVLQRLLSEDRKLLRVFRRAARAARTGRLFDATVTLCLSAGNGVVDASGSDAIRETADGGAQVPAGGGGAGPLRYLSYIQIQSCLLSPLVDPAPVDDPDTAPAVGAPHRGRRSGDGGGAGRSRAAEPLGAQAPGLRITHWAAPPPCGGVEGAALVAASSRHTRLGVQALAADVALGMITVVDFATGTVIYQNHNSQAYMGSAPPPEVMAAAEALEQERLEQLRRLSGVSAAAGAGAPTPPAVMAVAAGEGLPSAGHPFIHVPLLLRELLRHEPGALDRLQACLAAGEEFEETVQVPVTMAPFLSSLRAHQQLPGRGTGAGPCTAKLSADAVTPPGVIPKLAATAAAPCQAAASAAEAEATAVRWPIQAVLEDGSDGIVCGSTGALHMRPLGPGPFWTARNASSGRLPLHNLHPPHPHPPSHTHTQPQPQNACYQRANSGACTSAGGASHPLLSHASSALSQQGIASRACSGTSRLGRMTRPDDATSGAGLRLPPRPPRDDPAMQPQDVVALPPPAPQAPVQPSPLNFHRLRQSMLPLPPQPPHQNSLAHDGLISAAATSPLPQLDIPEQPLSLSVPTSPSAYGQTAFGTASPHYSQATPPVGAAQGAGSSLSGAAGVAGGGAWVGTGACTVVGAVNMSGSPAASPHQHAASSSLTNLARRMGRLLGRANTFAVGSAGSNRNDSSTSAGAGTGGGRGHQGPNSHQRLGATAMAAAGAPGAGPSAFSVGRTTSCGGASRFLAGCGASEADTLGGATGLGGFGPTKVGMEEEHEEGEQEDDALGPEPTSARSTPQRAPWAASAVAAAAAAAMSAVRQAGSSMLKGTTSEGSLQYGLAAAASLHEPISATAAAPRYSLQLQHQHQQQRPHQQQCHQHHLPMVARRRQVTGRASTGSWGLSRPLSSLQERGPSPPAAPGRWSIGANPRLTPYESAPAAAATFSGFMRGMRGASVGQILAALNSLAGGGVGGGVGGAVASNLSLPTPSQRRYGVSSPRAPSQGILVPPRRPAPVPSAASGFYSGLVGSVDCGDGGLAAAAVGDFSRRTQPAGGAGGGGGDLQVAPRSNSLLQALMSLPDRSHFFTRRLERRRHAVSKPQAAPPTNSSSTARGSLELRAGSTSGLCPPGGFAALLAGAQRPGGGGGPAAATATGGGGTAVAADSNLLADSRTSGGTTAHCVDAAPSDEDLMYGAYGGRGAAYGGSGVTGEMSELEASPFVLRIDSVTALKRANRSRRLPPRRASSHTNLARLQSGVTKSGSAAAHGRSSFGAEPAASTATAATVCAPTSSGGGGDSGGNKRITAPTLSAKAAASEAAAAELVRLRGRTGSMLTDLRAPLPAENRGGNVPPVPTRPKASAAAAAATSAAALALQATGDSAIEAAIAAAAAKSGALPVAGVAVVPARASPCNAWDAKPPAEPCAGPAAAAASPPVRSITGFNAVQVSYSGIEPVADASGGAMAAGIGPAVVTAGDASSSCDATVHSLLVGFQALMVDVASAANGGGSATASRSLPLFQVRGGAAGALETGSGDAEHGSGGSGGGAGGKPRVSIPLTSPPRSSSRGTTQRSLLSLYLGNYGSSGNIERPAGSGDAQRLNPTINNATTSATATAAAAETNPQPEVVSGDTYASAAPRVIDSICSPFTAGAAATVSGIVGGLGMKSHTSCRIEQFLPVPPPSEALREDESRAAAAALDTPDCTVMVTDSGDVDSPRSVARRVRPFILQLGALVGESAPAAMESTTANPVRAAAGGSGGVAGVIDPSGMPSATSIVAMAKAALVSAAEPAAALPQQQPAAALCAPVGLPCSSVTGQRDLGPTMAEAEGQEQDGAEGADEEDELEFDVGLAGGDQSRTARRSSDAGCDDGGCRRDEGWGGAAELPGAQGGSGASSGALRRGLLSTFSLEMARLRSSKAADKGEEKQRGDSGEGFGPNPIIKSGSYTAGASAPVAKANLAPVRKQLVRQSTHDRIERLLEIARTTVCAAAEDGSGLGANVGGGGEGVAGGAAGAAGGAAAAGRGAGGTTGPVWHTIHVCVCCNPATGAPMLVITQYDVTRQMDARTQLTVLLEREQKVLESIFPRHVIEYLTLQQPAAEASARSRMSAPGLNAANIQSAGAAGANGANGFLALQRSTAVQLASVATAHPCVTILFADIVGFTSMSKQVTPLEVMTFLNQLYSRFDAMLDIYKVYKVETIGDCFMVAGGLVAQDEEGWRTTITHDRLHAVRVLAFAKAMLREARKVQMPTGGPVLMRVGIHSGPVMSGVVGSRMPRFCLFGDTVNTASRMESTSKPGRIHVSADTHALLPNERWEPTGGVQVKGKGVMPTYLWASDVTEEKGEQLHRVLGVYL